MPLEHDKQDNLDRAAGYAYRRGIWSERPESGPTFGSAALNAGSAWPNVTVDDADAFPVEAEPFRLDD